MALKQAPGLLQGGLWWAGILGLIWFLPGRSWRSALPSNFPWSMALVWLGGVAGAGFLVALGAWWFGPRMSRWKFLVLLESVPGIGWVTLLLLLWPGSWGPPSTGAWVVLFAATFLPGELRWMAQALPSERPLPLAYGLTVTRRVRGLFLGRVAVDWVVSRWTTWVGGTLVIERLLGVRGPASDFVGRVVARDREGLALWVGALALVWALGWQRR